MGRPLKDISADEVFDLASKGCTQEEIAGHFGCARSVIGERFRQDYQLGSAASKTSIRSMQFARARKGSDVMLIHLGKTYLGQTDRIDVTTKGESVGATVILLPPKILHADDQTESGAANPIPGTDG